MIQIDLSCGCHYEYRYFKAEALGMGHHRIGFTPHGSSFEMVMDVTPELAFSLTPQQFYAYVMAHLQMRQLVGYENILVLTEIMNTKDG